MSNNELLQQLIAALHRVDGDPAVQPAEYITNGMRDALPQSVQDAVALAERLRLDVRGRPLHTDTDILGYAGYPVSAGEVDSYGWLSSVIQTGKGKLVF